MSIPDFVKILEVKRYSNNTIERYTSIVRMARHFFDQPLKKADESELHRYFYFMVHTKKASYSYQKQIAMALKLYYREMFGKTLNLEFLFPKRKPSKLPVVMARGDIMKMIENANNLKHKSMIALTYSAGLRVRELIDLKIRDIDSARLLIHVKSGKGSKDRRVPLSEKVLMILREYYRKYSPKNNLFEGQKGGKKSANQQFARLVLGRKVTD